MVVGKWTELGKFEHVINIGYIVLTVSKFNLKWRFSASYTPFELEELDALHLHQAKCDAISKVAEWFKHHMPLMEKAQRL